MSVNRKSAQPGIPKNKEERKEARRGEEIFKKEPERSMGEVRPRKKGDRGNYGIIFKFQKVKKKFKKGVGTLER